MTGESELLDCRLYGVRPQAWVKTDAADYTRPHRPCQGLRIAGLELPIDHFRLLGVSPATEPDAVLRALQQRLERFPDAGFTSEALEARAALLRASADVLCDPERRLAYEADLTALKEGGGDVSPGLDVPPSKEVGALILLHEAGQSLDAFEAARRSLQPPQAPALGSGREADLALVAGLACAAAAADLRRERRYEAAAGLLQQGLQLLQRMGQLPQQRQRLEAELQALLPFRVLDLISRDLSATAERAEGLALLETLVQRRGGLEGEGDPTFPREEFQAFIKQIRQFLTAQEQVDLFGRWAGSGSAAAQFLATYALTASGFAQRKPERILAARERLEATGQPGVEPFLACLHLLLGQIEPALASFERGASAELRQWAAEQGDDPLAQLCAYCRDWLSREVLRDYRDIETEADLEAYFADRDVQAFVEQQDRHRRRGGGSASREAVEPAAWESGWAAGALGHSGSDALGSAPSGAAGPALSPREGDGADLATEADRIRDRPQRSLRSAFPAVRKRPLLLALIAAVGIGAGGWLLLRPRPVPAPPKPLASPRPKPVATAPANPLPLTADAPSEAQLRTLLEGWLAAKAALLAGEKPRHPLADLAAPAQVGSALRQKRRLAARGEREQVKARIDAFRLVERAPGRIVAAVDLTYTDERRDSAGRVVESTGPLPLRNSYVFVRDGRTWKVLAFGRRG